MALRGEWHAPYSPAKLQEQRWQDWPRRHPVACTLGTWFLLVVMIVVLCRLLFSKGDWGSIAWLAIQGASTAVGLFGTRRASPDVEALMDSPGDVSQFPVDVTFKCGDMDYGPDAGVVNFVDGWLNYQGLETHFCVRFGDVDRVEKLDKAHARRIYFSDGRAASLTLTPRNVTIVAGEKRVGLGSRFESSMSEWTYQKPPKGTPVLPVLALKEGAVALRMRRARGSLRLLLLVVLVAAVASVTPLWSIAAVVGSVFALMCAVAWITNSSWLVQAAQFQNGKTPRNTSVWSRDLGKLFVRPAEDEPALPPAAGTRTSRR